MKTGPGSLLRRGQALLRKEWVEQRRLLLFALTCLLALWSCSVAVAFLVEDPVSGWLGWWIGSGFACSVLYALAPLHALLAGVLGFTESRFKGSREFLLALPVRPREIVAASGLAALGASVVFTAVGWCTVLLLGLLAGPGGDVPFFLRSLEAGGLTTLLATAPALAAGGLAGLRAAGFRRGLVLGLVLILLPAGALLAVCLPLARWGWWLPPWSLAWLAAALLMATSTLLLFESRGGGGISRRWVAGGLVGSSLLASLAVLWGMAWSLSPSEAAELRVEASPRAPVLLVRVGEGRLGRWNLEEALAGDPLDPLPGGPARRLGWGEEGDDLYWIRERPWSGEPGPREVLVSTSEAGVGLLLVLPSAPETPLAGDLLVEPGGRALLLDPTTGTIWDLRTGRPLVTVPGAARFAGPWGRRLVLEVERDENEAPEPSGKAVAVDLETGATTAVQGDLPLRSGVWMARHPTGEGRLPSPPAWEAQDSGPGELNLPSASPRWAHHLETLYLLRSDEIHRWNLVAWHPRVGERLLAEQVEEYRLLPGGNRLLIRRDERAWVLHAGTRRELPLDLPAASSLFDEDLAAVSPDGGWMAARVGARYHLVDLETGTADPIPVQEGGPGWVAWLPAPSEKAGGGGAEPRGWIVIRRDRSTFDLVAPSDMRIVRVRLDGGAERLDGGAERLAPIRSTPEPTRESP